MLDYMQATIIIDFKKDGEIKVENKIFNDIRSFNKSFNQINNINCRKEVWIDEAYISFSFKSEKSYNKALKVLYPTY